MLFKKKEIPLPDDKTALLKLAKATADPRQKYKILDSARALFPDDLDVRRALLLHGRAHECPRGTIDYSFIKCYLLHAFEHPEEHTEEEQRRMARELFDAPDLKECLALAPDAQKFLEEYLTDLCMEYARVFIAGDSTHVPKFMGFAQQKRLPEYLSVPAADVIRNIFLCPFLSGEEQLLLSGRFYRAYHLLVAGQVEPLDERLGEQVCALLA